MRGVPRLRRIILGPKQLGDDWGLLAPAVWTDFFTKLKQFRAIATRYDKTARCFLAGIHLAAAIIWLN